MSGFILPPTNHIAQFAPIEVLVDLLDRRNIEKLPSFQEALRIAHKNFPAGAKSVIIGCLRANDERWLISVGPRGGWKKIWNFGDGR